MKIKTILFDLDGTLIDTIPVILDTFRMTFDHFLPEVELSDQEMTLFLGQTLFETFGFYVDEEKVDEMVKYFREVSNLKIEEGLNAYPNAKEILAFLEKKNIAVGVVTSKMRHVASYHIELTGLTDYIDHLIGYEDTEKHKPNPDPLLKALDVFKGKKEQTIYIGDHENDMQAAKAAGMMCCAVTYSKRIREMLQTQPDFVVDDLIQIKDLI